MAKLAYALDLKSGSFWSVGSIPTGSTTTPFAIINIVVTSV